MPRCTRLRVTMPLSPSMLGVSSKSTQVDVVKAVRAESAELNAEANRPTKKATPNHGPKDPPMATMGYSLSVASGKGMPMRSACIQRSAPMLKNKTFAPTSTMVNAPMFHCDSRTFLQARFFCIMSWSRPVMATVTNMPARMCLTQWLPKRQSSVTQMRVSPVSSRT